MKLFRIASMVAAGLALTTTVLAIDLNVGGKGGVDVHVGSGGVDVHAGEHGGVGVGPKPGKPAVDVDVDLNVDIETPPANTQPPDNNPSKKPPKEDDVRRMIEKFTPDQRALFLLNCATVLATPAAFPHDYVLICTLAAKVLKP